MGRDKAELMVAGETLLRRTTRVALEADGRVLVVGRGPDELGLDRRKAPSPLLAGDELRQGARERGWDGVEFCPDEVPDAGPLGGLITALRRVGTVAMVACDMPRLSADTLRWLLAQAERMTEHGAATLCEGRLEPLFSVYGAGCLELCEDRQRRGAYALKDLIGAGDFARVEAPEWLVPCLYNVNTPADFAGI